MWALVTLCFAMSDCNRQADAQVLALFYTKESCHTYAKAVVHESSFVYFCADARNPIVED
jgi:hypothetical protein